MLGTLHRLSRNDTTHNLTFEVDKDVNLGWRVVAVIEHPQQVAHGDREGELLSNQMSVFSVSSE